MLYERKHDLCDAYGLGGSIVGGGLGVISGLVNNKLAAEREKEARRENYYYGEMAADKADKRTRALYEDYQTYGAQLRQIKEAGLSPSLLAGGTGAGGMTQGAQGTGATGVSPTTYGINLMEGAQLGLMQAQARKTNAEADTIEGKNERGQGEISELHEKVENLVAKTKNEGLRGALYEYDAALKEIEVGVQASISEDRIKSFTYEVNNLKHRARSAKVKADIDETTEQDVIKLANEQVKNVIADTCLKWANKGLAEANKELAKEQKNYVAKLQEFTEQQIQDLVSQITTREGQLQLNEKSFQQAVREWAVKEGIFSDENASFWDIMQKKLFSEHTGELIIKLVDALNN